jgi:hypothetical protein
MHASGIGTSGEGSEDKSLFIITRQLSLVILHIFHNSSFITHHTTSYLLHEQKDIDRITMALDHLEFRPGISYFYLSQA